MIKTKDVTYVGYKCPEFNVSYGRQHVVTDIVLASFNSPLSFYIICESIVPGVSKWVNFIIYSSTLRYMCVLHNQMMFD